MLMKRLDLIAFAAILSAGIAAAHGGVQNAAVKARMDAMSGIGADMKILGLMAKGTTPFDADVARATATTIASHAAATPELFEAEESDSKSEAKPAIWANFDDFSSKAEELEVVALGLPTSIASFDDLGPAMANLGTTCKSCHAVYRQSER
jgi:cytochrome c556